jgi:hypothetical protein
MGTIHRAFLLDAHGFKGKIIPLIQSLDAGEAQPLFDQSVAIIEKMVNTEWILSLAGSNLLDIRQVNAAGRPWPNSIEDQLEYSFSIPPYEIGYWLLIVFSDYLERCPGIGSNYSVLKGVLEMLAWSQEDISLLYKGIPTNLLLKPDSVPVSSVSLEDPYWYWMTPRAASSGWLTQEQVGYFYDKLLSEKDTIRTFDPHRFGDQWGGIPITIPEGQLDYLKRLHEAFDQALMMLETAQQAKREIFMTIA